MFKLELSETCQGRREGSIFSKKHEIETSEENKYEYGLTLCKSYLIIVADAADAVSVNFSGRCKFSQI